jgi:hypothetical protein
MAAFVSTISISTPPHATRSAPSKPGLGRAFRFTTGGTTFPCIARKGKLPVQAGASPAKGGDMKTITASLGAAAIALLAQTEAQAATLSVVTVTAPAVNCVFDASCRVVVSDQVGNLTYTPLGAGAQLQSRTFAAKAGTPGAGKTPISTASISPRAPASPNAWPAW